MPNRRSITSRVQRRVVLGLSEGPQRALAGSGSPERADKPLQGTPADSEALSAVFEAMSEREFQQHVEDALTARHWLWFHVPDSRRMNAGLVDVIAVHPGNPHRLLLFELKREVGGVVSPDQQRFIDAAKQVQVVDARIVKPSEWPAILEDL